MSSFSQERRIILATQAIENNQNLSRRQAAKIYEVPEATLRHRMNGRTVKNDSRNGRQKLTEIQRRRNCLNTFWTWMSEDSRPGSMVLKIWLIFFSGSAMADVSGSSGRQGSLHDDRSSKRV